MEISHSRKRSSAWVENDIKDVPSVYAPDISVEEAPSKRLQNARGEAIETTRPVLRYDAQKLLNALAFTRLYVTANFQFYDPSTSFIVVYLGFEQGPDYQRLW